MLDDDGERAAAGRESASMWDKADVAARDRSLRSLTDRLITLTDLTVTSIRSSEPVYRDSVPPNELQIAKSLREGLVAVRRPPDERAETAAWANQVGGRRARRGVPVEAMLRAYHIGGQVLFGAFLKWAADENLSHERTVALTDDVWRIVDLHCASATAGFRAVEEETVGSQAAESGRMLDALLNGDADRDAVQAAACACGLPEHGRYVVLVRRPSDWSAPPLTATELPAKVAGLRVRWRMHGGRALGVIAIGAATAPMIAAAVAAVPGRHTGVGLAVEGLAELGRARRLAELAVRTVTAPGGVTCLEERLPAALLTARPDLANELCSRVLGPLLTLDGTSRDMLFEALAAWLAADGSAQRAATALYCHRNTVLNRLRRLERMTRRSLSAPNDLVELALALEAFNVCAAAAPS
jgi:hypothetical protein